MLGFAAAASAGAGLAPSVGPLVGLRALQGVAAAAVLVAAFEFLGRSRTERGSRSLWTSAAILGAAVGPALGARLARDLPRTGTGDRRGSPRLSDDGALEFSQRIISPIGRLGDTTLVNGTFDPYLPVSRRLVRSRLLNASTARSMTSDSRTGESCG